MLPWPWEEHAKLIMRRLAMGRQGIRTHMWMDAKGVNLKTYPPDPPTDQDMWVVCQQYRFLARQAGMGNLVDSPFPK